MTEPQNKPHWNALYDRYVEEGVFEIRRTEMLPAWDAMRSAGLFPIPEARCRILEVGCGAGLFLDYLMEQGHRQEYLAGADLSEVAINITQSKMRLGDFRVCNVAEEPLPWPDEAFDTVFSGHTIEHVADPVVMLREMRRVTRVGGQIIIEYPHGDPPYVEHLHHMLDGEKVAGWMVEAGIDIVEHRPVVEMQPTNDGVVVGRRA